MKKALQPLLAVALGLALGLCVTWIAGEKPWRVFMILINGAFGSRENLGWTLFYTTPLIFTGLSVSIAFHAGLFNIGAEGQLTMGALAAAAVGALWPNIPFPFAPLLAIGAAVVAGGGWGAIPGWLRARRGSHEVINTIMLNFIAAGIASYVTLYVLKNPGSQNPETRPIGASYAIQHLGFFGEAPVSTAFFLAIISAAGVWLLLQRTSLGYQLRAVGQSEPASRAAGINPVRIRVLALSIAGALAGLVAAAEVLGASHKFKLEFSPDYGFIGIAVALLGKNHPAGICAAALLFGALHKGAAELDLETDHVTRELSLILQALVILCVSAEGLWTWMKKR